jgi:hypothetical protein
LHHQHLADITAIHWCCWLLPWQRKEGEAAAHLGESVEVRGWVRTVRNQKQFCFMQVGLKKPWLPP